MRPAAVVIERGAHFEVWRACLDKNCETYHELFASCDDRWDAEKIADFLNHEGAQKPT